MRKKNILNEEYIRSNIFIDPNDPKGCWNWTGTIKKGEVDGGYGLAKINYKQIRAHCGSYSVFKGTIPKGLYVLHTCHNRKCVNPDHLRLGTHQDNMNDMTASKRQTYGELNRNHKLTEADVWSVHVRNANGEKTSVIAKSLGVQSAAIYKILSGFRWTYVWEKFHNKKYEGKK